MVVIVFALSFFVVFGLTMALITRSDLYGEYLREGPGRISEHLRSRTRVVIGVFAAVLLGIALLEILIPDFHFLMTDMQYAVGSFLNAGPVGVIDLGSGGGISWGLYLSTFLGAATGAVLGTWTACRTFPTMRGVTPIELV
jgi:Trk-type K+ transport system membrane component